MKNYKILTDHITVLTSDSLTANTTGRSRMRYTPAVEEFINDVYSYCERFDIYNNYVALLQKNGIQWDFSSMTNANIDNLSPETLCALILGAVRADRFSDGALLRFIGNGSIVRWLKKLEEFDDAID